METTYGKKFKPWKDVKAGDTIYYYDHGKLYEQLVHSADLKEETHTFRYGFTTTTTTERKIIVKAGKGSMFSIYEYYMNASYYHDSYFTRFTCKEAAIDALKNHLGSLEHTCDRAKKKYERYLNSYNKYKACIDKYEKLISNVE